MPTTHESNEFSLNDKYQVEKGWVYMTGIQALVRLPIQQRLRDKAGGLHTGGYISGYRGSPMGRYDIELDKAAELLQVHGIQFRPGLNEDLAATAIWGSQYVGSFPGAKVDGVFSLWYGKGPGVDRSGDVLRHANLAGTSNRGGVLCIAGDDHGAKSSTAANFSDPIFVAAGMPLLYPASTQELLDYGLHGIAMSRYSGCWVGMKVVTDVVEGGGSVRVDPESPVIEVPPESSEAQAEASCHIRAKDTPLAQEKRLYEQKLDRALRYARLNRLNQISEINPRQEALRVGVVSAGKAWQDTLQALSNLGLAGEDGPRALRLLKLGMIWPLDAATVREFAQGLDVVLVVEEKRPLLEDQIRTQLYGTDRPPRIIGKFNQGSAFDLERGPAVFPAVGELSAAAVATALEAVLGLAPAPSSESVSLSAGAGAGPATPLRTPTFCSGCPHGRSTQLPAGSRALAGIGCHGIASLLDPGLTTTISHMGGEGVMWLGQQAFTDEKHVFANLGDGTLSHSGFLAVRQAVAANVPMTYKILYNGFVSMTGGQGVETGQTPLQILQGMAAEGVKKMAIVTDEVEKYRDIALPPGVTLHSREDLESVQVEFRDYPSVSIILYDQPCATERRRLRKRGKWTDPDKRAYIHAPVCEGCGDCSTVSGCMSIEPVDTALGCKRTINQDSCNKDYSCIEGFCPSFVTVQGGKVKRRKPEKSRAAAFLDSHVLPEPRLPTLDGSFNVLIAGIGGTGVVTIGQTLAVAAHVDGLYCSNLDITGLSQKYGAVTSHIRLARRPDSLHATRIGKGEAHTLIGCDLIASADPACLATLTRGASRGVISVDLTPTSEFSRNPDWAVDVDGLCTRFASLLGASVTFLESQRLAKALTGDSLAANMFILGVAWQQGLIPVSQAAILKAIGLNGVATEMNRQAFAWGRHAAHDLTGLEALLRTELPPGYQPLRFTSSAGKTPAGLGVEAQVSAPDDSVQTLIAARREHLVAHSGESLARRFDQLVGLARQKEEALGLSTQALTLAVARSYHRLLAVKDEWEVARLYSQPEFLESLGQTFEGDFKLRFHFGAWPLARRDKLGRQVKAEVGAWVLRPLAWLAKLRDLRGTLLDPFRHGAEARLARILTSQFEEDVATLLKDLAPANHALAVQIAQLMESVRGYGHVKERYAQQALAHRQALMARWPSEVVSR